MALTPDFISILLSNVPVSEDQTQATPLTAPAPISDLSSEMETATTVSGIVRKIFALCSGALIFGGVVRSPSASTWDSCLGGIPSFNPGILSFAPRKGCSHPRNAMARSIADRMVQRYRMV
eukprot:744421-Prymnesium_polylepis.1